MTPSAVEAEMPADRSETKLRVRVPGWALHRRLYDWVLSLAHTRHGTAALFAISFAESSFFPIPPDVLQIALTLERRERAWFYGLVSLFGSLLGAIVGYLIGWVFWEATHEFFYAYVFRREQFEMVQQLYAQWDFWIVFTAAFTPIPYKVITIAAGVCQISFPMFLLASLVGRGGRFFLVAGLLWWVGPSVKRFIDRYFNWLCVAFTVLLIGGFVVLKWMAEH